MSVAVYLRVSTKDQNLDGQRAQVVRWLKGNGLLDGAVWFEDTATGKDTSRPGFAALQEAVFQGDVDTVVVYKLDRLSRSLRDGIAVLCDWLERDVRVVAVTQQLDFAGATGKLIAATLFAVAEMEMELRAERQQAGIEAAKAKGVYRGRKPGTVKADPARARELREQGLAVPEVARALGVSVRSVRRYLGQGQPASTQ